MPRRRLLTVVATGAIAVAALAGCRVTSGADAAYVGSTRIAQSAVDDVMTSLRRDGAQIPAEQLGLVRQEVVSDLVFLDVVKRYSTDKGYPAPTVDYAAQAQQFSLPATDAYVRLSAEANAYTEALLQKVTPVTPTDADLHDVFDRAVKAGVVPSDAYEQVKPQLAQISSIGAGIALRNELNGVISGYNIKINPKFGQLEYPLSQLSSNSGSFTAVGLPLGATGGAGPAVVDVQPTGSAGTQAAQ